LTRIKACPPGPARLALSGQGEHAVVQFDSAAIRRHAAPGPGGAPCPPAGRLRGDFDSGDYADALRRPRPSGEVAPLALHVRVPFCASSCHSCACDRVVTGDRTRAAEYLDLLVQEMQLQRELLPPLHRVDQLQLGGGTPTFLSDGQLDALFGALYRNFRLSDAADRDYVIEIDPRTVDPARMGFLADLGFNRVNLGVQDFDPAVQRAVNRVHGEADTAALLRAARNHGFRSVNVDLILGLPLQTPERFARTLDAVLRLDPDRIALHGYVHEPERFPAQQCIDAADLPGPETRLALLAQAVERLDRAGYVYVGLDHFARPEDPLVRAQRDGTLRRGFQGYTAHGACDLIGLGSSAVSCVDRVCCRNARDLDAYRRAIGSGRLAIEEGVCLTDEDRLVWSVIEELTCQFRVDYGAFRSRFGAAFTDRFAAELRGLEPLREEGLVAFDDDALRVTERGRFLIRNVCMVFDRYLGAEIAPFPRAV
jgi:oxygen-independent coproporphyrinogen-3 oxidase